MGFRCKGCKEMKEGAPSMGSAGIGEGVCRACHKKMIFNSQEARRRNRRNGVNPSVNRSRQVQIPVLGVEDDQVHQLRRLRVVPAGKKLCKGCDEFKSPLDFSSKAGNLCKPCRAFQEGAVFRYSRSTYFLRWAANAEMKNAVKRRERRKLLKTQLETLGTGLREKPIKDTPIAPAQQIESPVLNNYLLSAMQKQMAQGFEKIHHEVAKINHELSLKVDRAELGG